MEPGQKVPPSRQRELHDAQQAKEGVFQTGTCEATLPGGARVLNASVFQVRHGHGRDRFQDKQFKRNVAAKGKG